MHWCEMLAADLRRGRAGDGQRGGGDGALLRRQDQPRRGGLRQQRRVREYRAARRRRREEGGLHPEVGAGRRDEDGVRDGQASDGRDAGGALRAFDLEVETDKEIINVWSWERCPP